MKKEILVTKDYSKFNFLKGNREVSKDRVNKIIKSIKNVGYITSPILVNEKLEIIDGQGRFEALKKLELPIEYIIQNGIDIKECIAMNINQTNWSIKDYIKSYSDKGNMSYILFYNMIKDYSKIKDYGIFYTAIFGSTKTNTDIIKNGLLDFSKEQEIEARKKIDFLYDILEEYKDFSKISTIIKACILCYYIEGVDIDILKEKLINKLDSGIGFFGVSMLEIMQQLEELYNKNRKKEYVYISTEYKKMALERMRKINREMYRRKNGGNI